MIDTRTRTRTRTRTHTTMQQHNHAQADGVFEVTFSDSATAGRQALLECNPPATLAYCWRDHGMGGNYPLFEWGGGCTVTRSGLPHTTPDTHEYAVVTECAGRGMCDRSTGLCKCFEGRAGHACQSVLQMV